jgi:hypothetical protein
MDNFPQQEEIQGIPVVKAADLLEQTNEASRIVITSRHFIEIYNQLVAHGVQKQKVSVFNAWLAY